MAQLSISKSVGDVQADGASSLNMYQDTLVVQYLLNRAVGPGRPSSPLPLNGECTPAMINAIRNYEAYVGFVDGRVDPGDWTMVALNAVGLSEFEGVSDPLEQRSIILRKNPDWNFTRGDFKTLTEFAGQSLRFSATSGWLPETLKTQYLALFNALLSPSIYPSATWGVGPLDWYHSHLGLWSGTQNVPVSAAAKAWTLAAAAMSTGIDHLRAPFLTNFAMQESSIPMYRPVYEARLLLPDVTALLNAYAALPEAVIIHHTFENDEWRPDMQKDDVRRHWMIDLSGRILTPPYRTSNELNDAQWRDEFICEGSIQVDFVIDKAGVIYPVLGGSFDLTVITDIGSDALLYP
jgi:hypothetical protein